MIYDTSSVWKVTAVATAAVVPVQSELVGLDGRTAVSVGVAVLSQGHLDELHLLGHGRQHPLLQTIELVKAAPGSHLTQTHKDTTHSLEKKKKKTHSHG